MINLNSKSILHTKVQWNINYNLIWEISWQSNLKVLIGPHPQLSYLCQHSLTYHSFTDCSMSCTVLIITSFLSAGVGEVEWFQQVLQGPGGDNVGVGPGHVIDHCHHLLLNIHRAWACRVGQKTREELVGDVCWTIGAGDGAEICSCCCTQQKCFFWTAHLK